MAGTKLSVVTVVYNGAGTIEQCIKSVHGQNYKNIEHIIVDGSSTDGTLEIIKKYNSILGAVVSESDNGIFDAMNKGIGLASGDIVGILNSDDFYADNQILSRVAGVFNNQDVDSCYGDLQYVDRANTDSIIRHWKSKSYSEKLFYRGWMPPHPTFFVRRGVYERYGVFNLNLGTAADYELMLRFLLKNGISTHYIPEVLVRMRTGGQSNVSILNRIKAKDG